MSKDIERRARSRLDELQKEQEALAKVYSRNEHTISVLRDILGETTDEASETGEGD